MEVLTFNVDADRRGLVKDVQDFNVDFHDSKYNWIQARQYENQMRQAQVNVIHADGTPFDLTGANAVFEGVLPDKTHRVIDARHGTIIDAASGQFRFDFPAPVFAVAGSYQQSFFRIYRNGQNIATLEFCLEVLADKVISGIVPSDYITPFTDLYGQLDTIVQNASGDLKAALTAWQTKLQDLFDSLSKTGKDTADALMQVQAGLTTLEAQIKSDGLMTQKDLDKVFTPLVAEIGSVTDFKASGDSLVDKTVNEFTDRGVNVKWFGAVGDGETDDTAAFKAALKQAHDAGVSSGLKEVPTVVVPSGRYKITEQLTMTPWMHMWSLGHVTLESYVADDSLLWIAPLEDDPYFAEYSAQQYTRAPIIGGGETRLLWSGGFTRSKEIGLEVGSRTDLGKEKPMSRYQIENLVVDSFYVGMKWNRFHHYLGSYSNCHFEPNTVELLIGEEDAIGDGIDSGENFVFDHCLFSEAAKGIVVNIGGFRLTMLSCSMDFIDKDFLFARGYGSIAYFGGHIENMRKIAVSTQTDQSLAYLSLTGTTINTMADYQLYEGTFNLVTNGVKYERTDAMSGNQLYLCDSRVIAQEHDTINQTNLTMLSPMLNMLYNPNFSDGELGLNEYTHSEVGVTNLGIKTSFPAAPGYNSVLGFSITGDTTSQFSWRADKISVKAGERMIAGLTLYTSLEDSWGGLSLLVKYYNAIGDLINDKEIPTNLSGAIKFGAWFPAYVSGIVPAHAVSAEIQYAIFHIPTAADFYIGESAAYTR